MKVFMMRANYTTHQSNSYIICGAFEIEVVQLLQLREAAPVQLPQPPSGLGTLPSFADPRIALRI
jgi:hypothetical protein